MATQPITPDTIILESDPQENTIAHLIAKQCNFTPFMSTRHGNIKRYNYLRCNECGKRLHTIYIGEGLTERMQRHFQTHNHQPGQ